MVQAKTMMDFYHLLGGVFYVIAGSDKAIRKEERDVLKKMIEKEWLAREESVDEFGSDAALQILSAFDWHVENGKTTEEILTEFEEYHQQHPELFSPYVNLLIIKTAERIAFSYRGYNISELMTLRKLSKILS